MLSNFKKKLKVENYILKDMNLYVAVDEPSSLFINNMFCLSKLSPCNMFEKLDIMMRSVDKCIVVMISSDLFRVFIKGMGSVKVDHNGDVHEIDSSLKINEATYAFSVWCDSEEIVKDKHFATEKNQLCNKSTFAFINVKNACMDEKNTQTGLLQLLKVKQIIERLLSFYPCENVNSDLEYIIVRFQDPLKLIHFIDKLSAVLDNVYLESLGKKEKLIYSVGISFGMFDKLYDHASSNNYSYCGIALNLCSRLAKLGESNVLISKEFCEIVQNQLGYLNFEAVSIGEQMLKGFKVQEIFMLRKCK